jgi:FkbM family methyltransferase
MHVQLQPSLLVKAVHPRWQGHLLLDTATHEVMHRELGSRGRYQFDGARLVAQWDGFPEDVFDLVEDTFVHQSLLEVDLTSAVFAKVCGPVFALKSFCVQIPNTQNCVNLRSGSSDIPTFRQVFVDREYESPHLPASAAHILDLGANIGLSALFFGIRYPEAQILCVEPDEANFGLLTRNISSLGPRACARLGAVWSADGLINVRSTSDDGFDLGYWGRQVTMDAGSAVSVVPAFHLATLLDEIDAQVDILKIDIEGAEREVFEGLAEGALSRVGLLTIETHDRFRRGSEAAVRGYLAKSGFVELSPVGENLFFRGPDAPAARSVKVKASSTA